MAGVHCSKYLLFGNLTMYRSCLLAAICLLAVSETASAQFFNYGGYNHSYSYSFPQQSYGNGGYGGNYGGYGQVQQVQQVQYLVPVTYRVPIFIQRPVVVQQAPVIQYVQPAPPACCPQSDSYHGQ